MSEEIIEILDATSENFGITIDWASQNAMPYVQQLTNKIIDYTLITNYTWLVVAFLFLAMSIIFFVMIKKSFFRNRDEKEALISFTIACFGIFVIITMLQIHSIITCHVFPEKIIWEFVRENGLLN